MRRGKIGGMLGVEGCAMPTFEARSTVADLKSQRTPARQLSLVVEDLLCARRSLPHPDSHLPQRPRGVRRSLRNQALRLLTLSTARAGTRARRSSPAGADFHRLGKLPCER